MKTSVTSTVSFTQIHHLAQLNWEQDGCPKGLDMEYYLAAESLLLRVGPRQAIEGKSAAPAIAKPFRAPVHARMTKSSKRTAL